MAMLVFMIHQYDNTSIWRKIHVCAKISSISVSIIDDMGSEEPTLLFFWLWDNPMTCLVSFIDATFGAKRSLEYLSKKSSDEKDIGENGA